MIILSGAGTVAGITDPSDLNDIWEFWEARLEGLNDNDPIATLTGQVSPGSGHNWTQSDGSKKPIYKTGVVNGQGVARFDGSNDEMANINTSTLSAVHLFVVVKIDNDPPAAGKNGLWSLGGGLDLYPDLSDTTKVKVADFHNVAEVFDRTGFALDTWRVYEVVSTTSAYKFRLDGTLLGTKSPLVQHQLSGFNPLGRSGPFDNIWLDGDIAGMYICSAELSDGDRLGFYGYLNDEFGTTAT